ncbi:hypothetical protein LTS18_010350 [Coniosporium uncinatum]|uniref:Uncharacterized protein n=1 Tax=Coniosporium uncinatum TaxID=93489 RepID=A0ACC3DLL8_9PEZI|nr:hypothetical protein LTS18_010350 [Coniosporium uncinatum]
MLDQLVPSNVEALEGRAISKIRNLLGQLMDPKANHWGPLEENLEQTLRNYDIVISRTPFPPERLDDWGELHSLQQSRIGSASKVVFLK